MIDLILHKIFNLKPEEIAAISLFGIIFLFRYIYLFLFTGRVLFGKRKNQNSDSVSLSLLITLRNEEINLKKYLPGLLNLKNKNIEVVVIDDFSSDNSLTVLGVMRSNNKNLKVSSLNQETRNSSKLALNLALKASGFDWVMKIPVTVSDINEAWAENLLKELTDSGVVVISYSNIEKDKGFFNLIARLEYYFQYIKTASYILNRLSFVYSEDNVAFKKVKYFEKGGFGKKIGEPYANLELVINSFIKKKETKIKFDSETSFHRAENITRDGYLEILNKSFRIEKHLSFGKRTMLFTDELSKLLFLPALGAVLILSPVLWPVFSILVFIYLVTYSIILKITQKRLKEHRIFLSSLLYDFFIPWFKLVYRWYFGQKSRKQIWRSKL